MTASTAIIAIGTSHELVRRMLVEGVPEAFLSLRIRMSQANANVMTQTE